MILFSRINQNYLETWNGWFNSGYLRYGGNEFTSVGMDVVSDSTLTLLPQDDFYLKVNAAVDFVYGSDTLTLGIDGFTGSKQTDQEGTKEGSGGWSGSARVHGPGHEDVNFVLGGTWDTDDANDYFNYDTSPPTYSADWAVTWSEIPGVSGSGGSSGSLQ